MKKLFVGIDVSKDVFDFCLLNQDNEILSKNQQLPNSKQGIQELCTYLKQFKQYQIQLYMEHTGHYGSLLAFELTKRNICFSLINPVEIKHSIGISRGKTDAVDAYRIACFALTNDHRIKPYILPEKQLQKLKVLISIRKRYSKIIVQLKNGLKALETLNQSIPLKQQINQQGVLIAQQQKAIDRIEQQIKEIIKSNEQLNQTFNKITQVVGVGPLTAAKCIVETDNFMRFTKARKFSCHSGLAPFKYQSGSSIKGKTRTSPMRNNDLKAILFKAATTAIQHDPQLKSYYNRKIKEGKHKLTVLNAVANKIVLRIFAVANRNEPFVKFCA